MKVTGQKFSLTIENTGEPIVSPLEKGLDKSIKDKFGFNDTFNEGMIQRKVQGQLPFNYGENPITPKPDDFVLFPFRLISATTVGAGTWKATDFSNEKVLKAAVDKLSNKPAYRNHDLYVGNEIGVIGTCQWSPKKGDIPAGIDGPYVIDSVLNAGLVRKMLSPVSPIQSSSVTVIFDWEASHDFENEYDFYYHLGEEIDGKMVRRIVTEIHDFIESSLVYLGADPYAKMRDKDGNLINIDRSSILSNSKFDEDKLKSLYEKEKKFIVINSFGKENMLALRNEYLKKGNSGENLDNKIEDDMLKKEIALAFGIEEKDVTIEKIKSMASISKVDFDAMVTKVSQLEGTVSEKENSIQSLTSSVNEFKTEVESLKVMSGLGESYLKKLREEAKSSYSKSVSGNVDEVITSEIDSCKDISLLESKIKMFNGRLITEFGAHCEDCNSKKISFRSSQPEGETKPLNQRNIHLSELL